MTNDIVERLRRCWASKKLQKEAADIIEQLQRERDEGDYYEGVQEGYKSGFRAGIETV